MAFKGREPEIGVVVLSAAAFKSPNQIELPFPPPQNGDSNAFLAGFIHHAVSLSAGFLSGSVSCPGEIAVNGTS